MERAQLDVDFARGHFPQLANGWAFFENAGGSYVPSSVIERLNDYVSRLQVQPGGPWPAAEEAAACLARSQQALAQMIGAGAHEVVIGPSTTLNVYVLAQALRAQLSPGDEIVVTNQDHEANSGAWRRLAEHGVVVREWRVDPLSAELDPRDLEALLGPRTRLVCFPHVSNIVGSINDVAAITRLAHAAGARVCVDGVAYAPHRAIDVAGWEVDFYLFSLYKIYGPHLAVLYSRAQHLDALANQNHYFLDQGPAWAKLNPGGQQHEVSAAAVGLVEYLEALDAHHFEAPATAMQPRMARLFELVARHEAALARPLCEFLAARNDVRLLGRADADPARRAPTFSLVAEGRDSEQLAKRMTRHRVAVRAGHFYAHRLLSDLGLLAAHNGVLRLSMVHYNSAAEVARLIEALESALA